MLLQSFFFYIQYIRAALQMVSDLSLPWKGLFICKYMLGRVSLLKLYVPEEHKIIWLMKNGSLSWCVDVKHLQTLV